MVVVVEDRRSVVVVLTGGGGGTLLLLVMVMAAGGPGNPRRHTESVGEKAVSGLHGLISREIVIPWVEIL